MVRFANAFADGGMDSEVSKNLVLETDVGGETVVVAGVFPADEIDFGEKFGAVRP